VVAAVVKWLLS